MAAALPYEVYRQTAIQTGTPEELALKLFQAVEVDAAAMAQSLESNQLDMLCNAANHAGTIFAALRDNWTAPPPATEVFRQAMSWCWLLCQRVAVQHEREALDNLLLITISYRDQLARRCGVAP